MKKNILSIPSKFIDEIFKKYPKLSKKKFYLTISIILALLLIYLIFFTSDADTLIPTFKVKRGNFLVSITESGELRAKNSISLIAPRVRGNLKITYLVPEGTYVKAGDTVIIFDQTEAINNVKENLSKLEVAESDRDKMLANHKSQRLRAENDVKNAELSLKLSKLSLEQMKFEAEIKQQETRLQVERNELNLIRTKQDLESQKIVQQSELNNSNITIAQRKADLEKAKKDLEMLTIVAPTDGLAVYEINWQTGRKIQIGDSPWPGMTLITLPDLNLMQSITYVNEVDVSNIRKGLSVLVKLDAFQDSSFWGTISKVASLGKTKDGTSGIKVFEIEVDINSYSEILKPGMTTSNKIIINEIPDAIYIPQEALFDKFDKKIVYVKDGNSFEERVVEIGEKNDNFIIIKKGLSEGEIVALRDPTIDLEEMNTPETEQNKIQKKVN